MKHKVTLKDPIIRRQLRLKKNAKREKILEKTSSVCLRKCFCKKTFLRKRVCYK